MLGGAVATCGGEPGFGAYPVPFHFAFIMARFRLGGNALLSSLFKSRGHLSPIVAALDPAARYASIRPSFIRTLSTSLPSALPHSSWTLHQEQATSNMPGRPYSEIPKTKTVLGLNIGIMKDPQKSTEYMEEQAHKLGHIFRVTGTPGLPEMVIVIDPQDIETVFRAGDTDYPMRMPIKEWKMGRKELNRPDGMFLEDGEAWLKQRLPISKFIMMPRKMAEYHEPFNHVVQDYLNLLRSQRNEDNLYLDITESLAKWSFESVSLFVLGKRLGCLGEEMPPDCKEFVDSVHILMETTNKLLFGFPFHKIWRTKKWKALIDSSNTMLSHCSKLVDEKIDQIEKSSKAGETEAELGTDFLTYMIHSGKMGVDEIAVNAVDLLTAGVDTTSLTMAACFYSLATNPDVQEKLRAEVQRVVGEDAVITPQHIQNMHFLRDTIKETMRMFPIAPNNTRILKQEVVLSGYNVPAGATIIMSTIVSGRLPELFPEPDKFKPERWSRDNVELPNAFSSLPFGFGRRMCVGRRVAELEMHILLAQMMRNFRIEYRDEKPMDFVSKLFYGPARRLDLALADVK